MSHVDALEQEIRRLPKEEVRQIYRWLADYVEDQETLFPEFVQRIEEGNRDIAEGRVRIAPGGKE